MLKPLTGILLAVVVSSIPSTTEYIAPEPEPLKELTVEDKIVMSAQAYGLDEDLMLRIASAESKFKNVPNYLYDGESGHYTAYGIFQITRTTYKAFCGNPDERLDIDKNIDCAMVIASKSGIHHWNESKNNWSNDNT